jgi:lysophospholipase L1-like esterase
VTASVLLVGLLGAGLACWGHAQNLALCFYAGAILLLTACGPLAFAAGRSRWPRVVLRSCFAVAIALAGLLATELVFAVGAALAAASQPAGDPDAEPAPLFSYAEARAHPAAFRRWWRHSWTAHARGPQPHIGPDPSGRNPLVLVPGSEVWWNESRVHINALGFRGEDIAVDKGEAFRIVVLGESTTFGFTWFASDRPWPEVLEQRIRDELGCAAPVEVINGGVPGWTVANQLERLEADVLPLAPDLVISYHGYNGFEFLFPHLAPMLASDPPREVERPSRLLAALENAHERRRFRERFEHTRQRASEVADMDLRLSAYAELYRRLASRLERAGIPTAVATFNMAVNDASPEEAIRFYEQAFPDLRERVLANHLHSRLVLEVPLGRRVLPIDVRDGLDGAYEDFYVDVIHFNQAGRDRLAENALAALRDLLLAHPRMRCGDRADQRR